LIAEPSNEFTPIRPGEGVSIAVAAVLLRLLICVIVCAHAHLTINNYARLYDGQSYIISAAAMSGDRSEFNDYQGRVFPGFPALIALVHLTGVALPVAAVAIDWSSAAVAAVLAATVFHDRRVGWAMVMLIPHYLMNSAMALSEGPLLAFTLAGIWFVYDEATPLGDRAIKRAGAVVAGGLLLGIALWIRPMACFAILGLTLGLLLKRTVSPSRRWMRIGIAAAAACAVDLYGLVLLHRWRGSALTGFRYAASSPVTYGGELITWPFHALLMVPIQRHVPIGRVAYVGTHAIVALIACGVILRRLMHRRHELDDRDLIAGPWLWTNTLFALCIGSMWGFECFHRFTIPAMPAMFWAIRTVFPSRPIGWWIIAMISTVMAVLTIVHDLPA
jgi:hypothetical protein